MNRKKRIRILYHSGAGSTQTIAEIYQELLAPFQVTLADISDEIDQEELRASDFLIIGFPTYHCEPSQTMRECIRDLPVFPKVKQAFVFTTCGLYAGNAVRHCIELLREKNIVVNGYASYRAPATDGVLLLPELSFMYRYEKRIHNHIQRDIGRIFAYATTRTLEESIPAFKFYTLLNYPNKVLGKAYTHTMHVDEGKCIHCDLCIRACSRKCWTKGESRPIFSKKNCESCFRCIHHCPTGAIYLSEKTADRRRLNRMFYQERKTEILQAINQRDQ